MHLIVGLGNPGKEYDGTRHNIGREIVRALADEWKVQKKLHAEIAGLKEGSRQGSNDNILLALSTTYMNDSGKSVQKILATYHLSPITLLIVHDDLDLPLGTLRFSKGSGAAGQKGVASIIDALGTKDFARLRIGVAGTHRATTDAAAYVLKKFSKDEQSTVSAVKKRAIEALHDFAKESLVEVMNRYN